MFKTVFVSWGAALLAVVLCLSPGLRKLVADDREVAKRCNNIALAPFVPLDAGARLARTSQAIDRVLFTSPDPDPKKTFKLNDWNNAENDSATSNYGKDFARIGFRRMSAENAKVPVLNPCLVSQIQLLPDFERFLGVKPWGRLISIYSCSEPPENDWFPAGTRVGLFGGTFSTQKAETPEGDREFVRVQKQDENNRPCFSLPIDLAADHTVKDSFGVRPIEMPSHAEYEDFGNTEWMIYSRIVDYGVEISQSEIRWDYATSTQVQTGEVSTERYRVGDMFQVSNLKFRIEEIVRFDNQEVAAAWVNISEIDIVRQ